MATELAPITQHHVDEMVERLVAEFGDGFEPNRIEELMAVRSRN